MNPMLGLGSFSTNNVENDISELAPLIGFVAGLWLLALTVVLCGRLLRILVYYNPNWNIRLKEVLH